MIELGYDILEEKQNETTNFSFITKLRGERSSILIDIISPKSKDLIILHSTSIMRGKDIRSFRALKPEALQSLRYPMNKNALLANLYLKHEIRKEEVAISISDDIVTDGLTKDRLYDTTKRILAFNEFMGYVYGEYGLVSDKESDRSQTWYIDKLFNSYPHEIDVCWSTVVFPKFFLR